MLITNCINLQINYIHMISSLTFTTEITRVIEAFYGSVIVHGVLLGECLSPMLLPLYINKATR